MATKKRGAGSARGAQASNPVAAKAARKPAAPLPRVKVAIVGGGMAGLSAAWELTRQNADEKRPVDYDINIYEQSPRLGGKGASTRDAHGRILEHGLHVWLGFYENAFRIMRECYAEVEQRGWGPDSDKAESRLAHGRFNDAFYPEPHIGVAARRRSGDLDVWSGFLPPMNGQPGEPLGLDSNPFTLWAYAARSLALVRALMQSILAPAQGAGLPGGARPDGRSASDEAQDLDFSFDPKRSPAMSIEHMTRMLRVGVLTSSAGLLQAVTILEGWLRERNPAPQSSRTILKFVEALATQSRKQLRDFVAIDEELRRKTEIVDIVLTIIVGLYRDRVFFSKQGLDAINHIDYRAWLKGHGATKTALSSPFITGIYDLVFAYRAGDRQRPALAAGQALRGALRMFFSYRGAIFWRMASGMGDAVFAPLYKVLSKRGVRFHFNHKLKKVDFDLDGAEGPVVSRLHFDVEGQIGDVLDAFGCWPHEVGKLTARPTRVLKYDTSARGNEPPATSFDAVIFAAGIEALDQAGGEALRSALPSWAAMQENVKTVATQSAQVWLTGDLAQLGWRRGSVIVTAFDGPLETWADMTRTLASEEAWRKKLLQAQKSQRRPAGAHPARSVAYFCGVLPDKGSVKDVRANAEQMLKDKLKTIWPAAYGAATESGATRSPMDLLADAGGRRPPGTMHFTDQHFQANTIGSERYTLSLPGSIGFRISPLDASVRNMSLAGDWTHCGFNAGCIEAAAMSGLLAARAISGKPDLNSIVGYHHP